MTKQEQTLELLNLLYRLGAAVQLAKTGECTVINYQDCTLEVRPKRPALNDNHSQLGQQNKIDHISSTPTDGSKE